MNWSPRREKFRAILSGSRCIHPGSVFDPLSARIAEELGFEAGILAGSMASLAVLGAPDLAVLTLSEFADLAHRIDRAAKLPVMVDADHGYGNALNVMRTVQELETAGVAALSIEDTLLPEPFGGTGKAQFISIEEGAGKMRAALVAWQDPALAIFGRTGAMAVDTADAVKRIKAYADSGVDAIFLVGVTTRAQLETAASAVKIPLVLGGAAHGLVTPDELAKMGFRIQLQSYAPLIAAIRAVYDTLKALKDGTPPDKIPNLASGEMMKRLTRDADYRRWTKEFLGGVSGERG